MHDAPYPASVDHPDYYNDPDLPIACIQVAEHFSFCRGKGIKYLWHAGQKGGGIEDLHQARWYVEREIERLDRKRHAARHTHEDLT